jgi:hypothetical protein
VELPGCAGGEWGPPGSERSLWDSVVGEGERGAGQGQLCLFAIRLHAGTVTWHAMYAKMLGFGKLKISSISSGNKYVIVILRMRIGRMTIFIMVKM